MSKEKGMEMDRDAREGSRREEVVDREKRKGDR